MISKPRDLGTRRNYPSALIMGSETVIKNEIDILKDPEIFINIISRTAGNHKVVVWDPENSVWKTFHKGADKKPVPGDYFTVWTDKIKSDLKGE